MHYPRTVEGLTAKHTGPKGYGIFTARSYKKEEVVFRVNGIKIHHSDKRLSHRAVQISKDMFLEPKKYSATWYLNHSCTPNCYVEGDAIIARRALKRDEEITADYSLFTDFPSWDMECHCGTKQCRVLIVLYRLLPASLRSTGHVSSYLAAAREQVHPRYANRELVTAQHGIDGPAKAAKRRKNAPSPRR